MSFSAVHTVYCESGLTLCLWPRLNLTFEIQWPLRFTCFNSFPAHFIEYLLRIWSFFSSKIIWHLFENVSTTLSVVFKFLYDIWTIISNNYLIVMSLFGLQQFSSPVSCFKWHSILRAGLSHCSISYLLNLTLGKVICPATSSALSHGAHCYSFPFCRFLSDHISSYLFG